MSTRTTSRSPVPVLTIAGFDPSSGAGITADLKVFAAHRLYGTSAITALTVQSTAGVLRVEPAGPGLLHDTLLCLAGDLPPAGIKIGMLATAMNVGVVANFLSTLPEATPVVLDPVIRSTSGHPLLDPPALDRLRNELLPRATVVTPNTEELSLLLGGGHQPTGDARQAVLAGAEALARRYPALSLVVTGGHLTRPDDLVLTPGAGPAWLSGEWVHTAATHGTGCGFSSALLCSLVLGRPVLEAARDAKQYVTEALRAAQPMGHGGGSMHHLHGTCGPFHASEAQWSATKPPVERHTG